MIKRTKLITRIVVLAFLIATSISSAYSQTYQVNGAAVDHGNGLVNLTPQVGGSVGTAWSTTKIDLTQPFDMSFDMFFGCQKLGDGGDGITFTFQNQGLTSIGAAGGNLGLYGITPALSIEFDTYDGSGAGGGNEIPEDHIAIDVNGEVNNTNQFFTGTAGTPVTVQPISGGRDLEDCATFANDFFSIRIVWDPIAKTLQLYESGVLTLTYTNDVVATIFGGNSEVYWGFTSATGAASNEHWIAPVGTVIPWGCTVNSCCAPFTVTPTSTGSGCNFTLDAGAVYDQYNWSDGSSTPTTDVTASGTYTINVVQMQAGTACPGSGEVTIATAAPTATLSGSGTICNDGTTTTPLTVTLTGTPNWDLVYAIDGINQDTVIGITTSPYIINGQSQHTYTLVAVVDAGGCPGTVSGTATVNAITGLPIGNNNSFNSPSGSTTLTVDNDGGTYEWYSGSCGGTLVETGTSYLTPTLSATTTYYVKNTALTASSTKFVSLSDKLDPDAVGTPNNPNDAAPNHPKAVTFINFTANQDFNFDGLTCAVRLSFGAWVSSKVSVTITDFTVPGSATFETAIVTQPAGWVSGTDENVYVALNYPIVSGHSYRIAYEGQNSGGGFGGSMQSIMYWSLVTITPFGTPYHITKDAELDITHSEAPSTRYPGMFNWEITAGSPAYACDCTPVVAIMETIMPVSMLYFKGSLQPSGIAALEWATANETNNNYFTVQSSSDGIHFTNLQNIPGAGTSNSANYYSAIDKPASSITYYRIMQTDFDGTVTYSEIISISTGQIEFSVQLFPNPSSWGEETYIKIIGAGANEVLKLDIYDLLGRVVYSINLTTNEAGSVYQSLDMFSESIPTGTYIVLVASDINGQHKQKFIVVN